ncbi:helix-turn-helix domain-containing protein [Flagellimonas oceanensis]|mgnify:FL=1|uniref:helix-turn-helix domain-containing protein n=1 Tax=Flagellimonas oceanensis TaxID=2499163 RepID=UPI000F8F5219|nr:helix-turn-helix domain-containing protein [Allomuricauda oceanensis]|tara:strand:- start:5692 stop:7212 length:1521 start_codon:yes stop_codon:yes gene_type:complete
MRQFTNNIVLLFLWLNLAFAYGITNNSGYAGFPAPTAETFQDSLDWADYYFNIHRFEEAIPLYKKNLDVNDEEEKIHILKKLALSEAALDAPEESVAYIYDYFKIDFQPTFLLHEDFDGIRNDTNFSKLSGSVLPKITLWSVFYFFVSLIGFYVSFLLLINKKIDKQASILIAAFVFIHSLFILNICVDQTNYVFEFPHTYLMTTWSSLLYGPLLFLYFKRVSKSTDLSKKDLWHFLPTVILTIYLILTVYGFSGSYKVNQMLQQLEEGPNPETSTKLLLIVSLKTISLGVYAFFVHSILTKNKAGLGKKTQVWQKNIYLIHVSYVVFYIIYGSSLIAGMDSGVLLYTPIVLMSAMVLYVGYAANVQPDVFSGRYAYTNRLFPKYVKSGLTDSLSQELKKDLTDLFQKEKLYRKSDINLDMVAEKLDTTRHNASQLINEHFNMSFREFVNSHRIQEAKELLEKENELNIIDIAYEVGYNNKVSFNKAFKKDTHLTPSQYLNHLNQG